MKVVNMDEKNQNALYIHDFEVCCSELRGFDVYDTILPSLGHRVLFNWVKALESIDLTSHASSEVDLLYRFETQMQ